MKGKVRIVLAVVVLWLATLACAAVTGGESAETPEIPAVEAAPTDASKGETILSDDFSEDAWGTGTDEDSSLEYENEALRFIIYKENFFVWSMPEKKTYSNIHVEVTAYDNSSDPNTAFGVMCNLEDGSSNYYFAVTPSGLYAIAKSQETEEDLFLTNDDQWGTSDLIPQNQSSYRIGVDCASDGTLTLYINGAQIDSVKDTTYTAGRVGLMVWSADEPSASDVSFDDFEMTSLP